MKFFGLIEYPKNNVSMNKIEQEEQEDEYIKASDFLNIGVDIGKICY